MTGHEPLQGKETPVRRHTTWGRVARAFAAAALATSLAACSGTATTPDNDTAASTASNTLTFGAVSAGGAPTTDPHGQLFSESDWARLSAIYDTLTVRGDDGAPAPGLAETWEAAEDATEWTFTLRDDATFSDGTKVTAADALHSIGRLQAKTAENGGRIGAVDMDRSKAVDNDTLLLVTPAPDAELPLALTVGSFVVKDGTEDFTDPIGSGPFVLDSLDDQAASLRANEDWWGGTAGVNTLEIRGFADPQAMAQAVTSGAIDMAAGIQPAAAKASESSDVLVSARPGAEAVPLLMRVDTEPLDDNRVREAIKLSLDREALIDQVYLGYGEVGKDMIRLSDPGVPDVPEVKRDLERAKELLVEAGHPDGFTTTLHTSKAYPAMVPLATVVKEQLAEVGITVEITEHAPDQYWTTAYGVEPFTVGYYGGSTTFGLLVRATVLSDAAYSETGWKNAEFDEAYAAAMATTDEAERNELMGDLYKEMAREGGWVVWGFGDRLTLYRTNVNGVKETGPLYDLSGITVDG